MNDYRKLFVFYIILMSIIAFALYGIDKRRSIKGAWRIRESVLLSFGFLGGATGALLGMKTFHHKTRHWYFWGFNMLGIIWQVAAIFYLG